MVRLISFGRSHPEPFRPTLALALATAAIVLLVWELYICEGAHLGRRFVVWLYDLTADRYNQIKGFDRAWEKRFLGEPVAQVIGTLPGARLLDAGAGTGRLAWALEAGGNYAAPIVCLEPSRPMIGRQLPTDGRVRRDWAQGTLERLPFDNATFDLVSSLEVLEFTPSPRHTLAELVRVLRPGGWLLVTNRIGWQAPLILGRTCPRGRFAQMLAGHGLTEVEVFPWQKDYDLAWARKPDALPEVELP